MTATTVALTAAYWHLTEGWLVHSTVGPNLTATYPGALLVAVPAAVTAWVLRPWAEAIYERHHARHAAQHDHTRAQMAARFDHLLHEIGASEGGAATAAQAQLLVELLSEECPRCGTTTGVGRRHERCPEK